MPKLFRGRGRGMVESQGHLLLSFWNGIVFCHDWRLGRTSLRGAQERRPRRLVQHFVCGILAVGLIWPQTPHLLGSELGARRAVLDGDFRADLDDLAQRCRELGLTEQAKQTAGWSVTRDPRRQYLFLIPGVAPTLPPPGAPKLVQQWHQRFMAHRREHADALLELAQSALQAGQGATAYQLLYEILREDPDHKIARRALRFRRTNRGWQKPGPGIRRIRIRSPHPQFGWSARKYWRVESQHFRITTSHSLAAGRRLAAELEEFYGLWQQLFFRFWSDTNALAARLVRHEAVLGRERKHAVVLFRDREEYVGKLSSVEPRIAVSLGYYMYGRRTSFLYAGDESLRSTWFHEVAHQLFQESPSAIKDAGERWNFWVVEGIATYLESLARHDGYWTVGGFDADRLQYARARTLNGGEYTPLRELVRLGRDQLQQDPDIRRLYTQSAGLIHFMMDGSDHRFRQSLVGLLQAVYLRRDSIQSLARLTDTDLDQIDVLYRQFLNVQDEDLVHVSRPPEIRSLALGHTSITDRGLKDLRDCRQLEWLDVSFTQVSDKGLMDLSELTSLRQLSLEQTRITDRSLDVVGRFRRLEELDLSGTAITDAGMAKLTTLKHLTALWLTDTRVTDEVLTSLKELPRLERVDITGTGISPAAWNEFRPHLERNQ